MMRIRWVVGSLASSTATVRVTLLSVPSPWMAVIRLAESVPPSQAAVKVGMSAESWGK